MLCAHEGFLQRGGNVEGMLLQISRSGRLAPHTRHSTRALPLFAPEPKVHTARWVECMIIGASLCALALEFHVAR